MLNVGLAGYHLVLCAQIHTLCKTELRPNQQLHINVVFNVVVQLLGVSYVLLWYASTKHTCARLSGWQTSCNVSCAQAQTFGL